MCDPLRPDPSFYRHQFVSYEVTQSFFSSACLLALEASWDYYLRHCDYL